MNRLKLNKIVSYIGFQNEFPFDVLDVTEDFWQVLEYFCIYAVLETEEQKVMQAELQKIAEAAQTSEMVRLAAGELALPEATGNGQHVRNTQTIRFTEWLKTFPEEIQRSFIASLSG